MTGKNNEDICTYSGGVKAIGLKQRRCGAQSNSCSSLNQRDEVSSFPRGLRPPGPTLLPRAAALSPPSRWLQDLCGHLSCRGAHLGGGRGVPGRQGARCCPFCTPGAFHQHQLPAKAHSHPTVVCHLRHHSTPRGPQEHVHQDKYIPGGNGKAVRPSGFLLPLSKSQGMAFIKFDVSE